MRRGLVNLIMVGVVASGGVYVGQRPTHGGVVVPVIPVCATEDSPSCVWVGPLQGNRRGATVINGPDSH